MDSSSYQDFRANFLKNVGQYEHTVRREAWFPGDILSVPQEESPVSVSEPRYLIVRRQRQ